MPEVLYKPSAWGAEFHALTVFEALGAGAAGPGKTTVLIAEPFPQIQIEHARCMRYSTAKLAHLFPHLSKDEIAMIGDHPLRWGESLGYALFLRRELTQVGQVSDRTLRLFKHLDPDAEYDKQKHMWTFKSGYKYRFGHCQNSNDWMQYQSDEFTILLWDELTMFEQGQYDGVNTRLRSSDPVLRPMCKIRAMSNPFHSSDGSTSVKDPHWVRRRFVDDAPEGRVLLQGEYKDPFDGTTIIKERIYLPAKLTDNPDKEFVKAYTATLIDKPAHIRAALIEGDWYTVVGAFFSDAWKRGIHVVPPRRIPDDWPRFRSLDWGYKTFGAVHWYAMDYDGNLWVERELTFRLMDAAVVARRVREIEEDLGLWDGDRSLITGPADTQLWEERGDIAGLTKAEEFSREGVMWVPADKKSRARNAEHVMKRLNDHGEGRYMPGLVVFDTCRQLIKTLPTLPGDPNHPEEPLKCEDDHWYDSLSYGCAYASRGRSGISGRRMPKARDDDDDDAPSAKSNRGRYGYGSSIM